MLNRREKRKVLLNTAFSTIRYLFVNVYLYYYWGVQVIVIQGHYTLLLLIDFVGSDNQLSSFDGFLKNFATRYVVPTVQPWFSRLFSHLHSIHLANLDLPRSIHNYVLQRMRVEDQHNLCTILERILIPSQSLFDLLIAFHLITCCNIILKILIECMRVFA